MEEFFDGAPFQFLKRSDLMSFLNHVVTPITRLSRVARAYTEPHHLQLPSDSKILCPCNPDIGWRQGSKTDPVLQDAGNFRSAYLLRRCDEWLSRNPRDCR